MGHPTVFNSHHFVTASLPHPPPNLHYIVVLKITIYYATSVMLAAMMNQTIENEKEFTQDVLDSLNAALSLGEIPQEKILMMVLEINSSKREYNISMDRMSSLIFIAFLRLHNNHKFSTLKQRIDNYTQLLCKYYSTRSAQNGLLKGLNEVYASNRGLFSPIVAKIIHHLFEVDILEEESILEWHGNLDPKDPIKDLVGVLIDWLNE